MQGCILLLKKCSSLAWIFLSLPLHFLNVKKAGTEEALQICEHFTTALSNYYCHIMYFSLRLPFLWVLVCVLFLFLWNTKYLYSSFCVHLCFLTLLLHTIPLAADTERQSGYPVFWVNWFSQSRFQLLSMPPILGLPLEADSKFLGVTLRCEKWFTHSVTGPINRFCP